MRNLLLCCLAVCSFIKIGHTQDIRKVDSLLAIYNNEKSADTLKIKVLGNLYNAYLYTDIEKSEEYLSKALTLSKEIKYDRGIALCTFQQGVLYDLRGELDSASLYYLQAKAYYQKVNDPEMLGQANLNLSNIAYQKGAYQKAVEITKSSIEFFRNSSEEGVPLAMAYEMLGRVYDAQGYYKLALENILKAMKLYEKNNNEVRKADAIQVLGGIELSLLNYQKSVEYNLQAANIYEKHQDNYFLAQVHNDLGNTYFYLKDYENAKQYLHQSIALSKAMKASDLEGTALTNLGKVYVEEGNFEQAVEVLENSLAIHQSSEYNNKIVESLNSLGRAYLQLNQPNKAISILNQAVNLADSIQSLENLKQSYFYRAEVFEKLNNSQAALLDYQKFHSLSDTILNKTKISQIEELRIIHDTEQKEKEIALFTKNAELDEVKKTRLWISLVAAIGLGSLLLWTQWQRRRKEKLLHQKEQEIQVEKNRVAVLENQKLNQELDFKKQELTSKVLQLCRKNEFLQSLNKEVKEFKTESEGSEKHRLEKLSRKINRDIDVDADWEQFLRSFETVHPDFNRMLLHKYPNFVPHEVRMACLMRMNLESKDIANLLNITPDGVKKARYRMRKKMGKDSDVNLTEYFMNFGNVNSHRF